MWDFLTKNSSNEVSLYEEFSSINFRLKNLIKLSMARLVNFIIVQALGARCLFTNIRSIDCSQHVDSTAASFSNNRWAVRYDWRCSRSTGFFCKLTLYSSSVNSTHFFIEWQIYFLENIWNFEFLHRKCMQNDFSSTFLSFIEQFSPWNVQKLPTKHKLHEEYIFSIDKHKT